MNTAFLYFYRDGANCRRDSEGLVLRGSFRPEQEERLRATLDNFNGFVARQVGVPEVFLWIARGEQPIPGVDHGWHTFLRLEQTAVEATDPRTVEELVTAFECAAANGWREVRLE